MRSILPCVAAAAVALLSGCERDAPDAANGPAPVASSPEVVSATAESVPETPEGSSPATAPTKPTSPATAPGSPPPPPPPPSLPPQEAGLALPDTFRINGTEPFWGGTVEPGRLTYMTPENQAGSRVPVTRRLSGQAVEIAGMLGGKPLVLTITAGPCSDGMSDVVYPYAVTRRLGQDVQRGCARP